MGFKRNIGGAAFGCALLVGPLAAQAAPEREPLDVTTLADPEADLVSVSGPEAGTSPDDRIRSFTQALDQAAAIERRAVAARCKSLRTIPVAGSGRDAWEANCRYQRR